MAVVITGSNTPTAGGITYGDGSTYATTSAGTSGQVLTSAGSSAPTWTTPSSGAMTLVSSATASSSASVSFTSLSSSYRAYMLEYDSVYLSSDGQNFLMQVSTDNGSTYLSTGYARSLVRVVGAGTTAGANYAASDTVFYIGALDGFSNLSTRTGSGTIYFFAPNTSGTSPSFIETTVTKNTNGVNEFVTGSMIHVTTNAINAFKLYSSSGTITAGNFRLYGIANS